MRKTRKELNNNKDSDRNNHNNTIFTLRQNKLVSEWPWVTLGLQDSFQYSSRSHHVCSLDGLDSFSDFQLFQSFLQTFYHFSS